MLDAALLSKGFDIVWFAANNGHNFSTLNISQGVEVFPSEGFPAPATHIFILRPPKVTLGRGRLVCTVVCANGQL